eukprot:NODE_719_length_4493_cov_0.423987.p4 type:complete len:126 gc:universal NODE_719_length_4493_cov_0.423987:3427-3050(-)
MEAPSLVIVTFPISSTIILSRPIGPKLVFTMFANDCAAVTFCALTSRPENLSPGNKSVCASLCDGIFLLQLFSPIFLRIVKIYFSDANIVQICEYFQSLEEPVQLPILLSVDQNTRSPLFHLNPF